MSAICNMCGRSLTDAASIALGVGPECAQAYTVQAGAVARVERAVDTGLYSHPQLTRTLQLLRAADGRKASSEKARRDVLRLRGIVANWASKIEEAGIRLPEAIAPFSPDPADRPEDADAARPVLTAEERAEMAEYDRWRAQIAADQAPLDGCEDEGETRAASLMAWWTAAVVA